MIRDLHHSVTATLDSNGQATINTGPAYYNEYWDVTSIAVTSQPTTKVPSVHVFKGVVLLGYTFGGNNDTGDVQVLLYANEKLTSIWGYQPPRGRVGDAGVQVTLTLYGKQYIGEEPLR